MGQGDQDRVQVIDHVAVVRNRTPGPEPGGRQIGPFRHRVADDIQVHDVAQFCQAGLVRAAHAAAAQ